jgi:hypothetical protein
MSISERITDMWGITESKLLLQPESHYARAKARISQDQINDLYRRYTSVQPIPAEAEVDALNNDLIERYIAAKTVIKLIPVARDMYMQERISKSASQSFGGSMSSSYIDRTRELDDLEQALLAEVEDLQDYVIGIIQPVPITRRPISAPVVSSNASSVVDPIYEFNRRKGMRYG